MKLPLMLVLTLSAALPQTAATSVKVTPKVSVQLDLGAVTGKPCQLAWAPDGKSLYLQTYTPNPDGTLTRIHYAVALPSGAVTPMAEEPAWAQEALAWQTGKNAPDDPAFAIALQQSVKEMTATSVPMGGDYAKGGNPGPGAGTTADDVMSAAQQSQKVPVYTLSIKGDVVGEFVNEPLMPGYTFGWGPKGSGLVAYGQKSDGKLVIMDKSGAKQRVDSLKNVVMPAWTADGAHLAFLENQGKKKYTLVIADITK